jgi:hypothetical protein
MVILVWRQRKYTHIKFVKNLSVYKDILDESNLGNV